jgi:putative ABC transport system ATP-binding protein
MNNVYSPTSSPEPSDWLINMQQGVKVYPTAAGPLTALKGITLQVRRGAFVAISGKSGAGKTTLINMLSGVDHLTSGEVWVNGAPLHTLGEDALASWRGANLGIIYQSFYLMPSLSIIDNVMLPVDLAGRFERRRTPQEALALLRQVGLEDHAYKLPSEISGGQQQRVAVARALANDPPLLLADEPTGRLDSANAENIFQIFLALVERGKTILMVTHDENLAQRLPRRLILVDGEISEAFP